MKSRFYILLVVIAVIGLLLCVRHRPPNSMPEAPDSPTSVPMSGTPVSPAPATLAPPAKPATQISSHSAAQQPTPILSGKDQAVQAAMREENQKSLDLYGKVVDQYGAPVVDATVRGSIGINISMVESGGQVLYTQTDSQGCFNFMRIRGAGIGIWPQKKGYFYNLKIPWQRPADYKPNPENPLIFTMWRIRGNGPLIHTSINADLQNDGRSVVFDSNTGNQTDDGDLKLIFVRSPNDLKPGLVRPFNWQFKIELVNGGLVKEDDYYPYQSPDSGYQPSFAAGFISNSVPWQNQLAQNFYIKNSSGKYGLLSLMVYSASTPPQAEVNITFNPSGSQNLEPDFSRQ